MATLRFATPRDFAFDPTVRSHGWYLLAPFGWDSRTRRLHRAEIVGGRAVDLILRASRGRLVVEGPDGLDDHAAEIESKLRRMFQLEVETAGFVAAAAAVPTHRWVATSGFGRLLCGATRFEDAVKIIATTNTTWKQTMRMVELLVRRCGSRAASGQAAFPSAAQVAGVSPSALQEECRLGYRAKTIHALAEGVGSGSIDLDGLHDSSLSPEEQLARYRTLPGIGPYGAAHLMAMDGRHDFIAVDTEFRRFVRARYHGGRPVSDATLVRRYRRWGRWRYLAYWAELWEEGSPALVKFEPGDE